MQEFKVGDKVRYIPNGDTGVVIDREAPEYFKDSVWVNWQTGEDQGKIKHAINTSLELIVEVNNEISVGQALDILVKAGYTVTLSKT
jgi:Uma2 family endonuclease